MVQDNKFKTEKKAQEINPDRGIYYIGHEIDDTELLLDSSEPGDEIIEVITEEKYLQRTTKLREVSSITYFPNEDIVFAEISVLVKKGDILMTAPTFKDSYIGINIPKEKYTLLISTNVLQKLVSYFLYDTYVTTEKGYEFTMALIRIGRKELLSFCEKNY